MTTPELSYRPPIFAHVDRPAGAPFVDQPGAGHHELERMRAVVAAIAAGNTGKVEELVAEARSGPGAIGIFMLAAGVTSYALSLRGIGSVPGARLQSLEFNRRGRRVEPEQVDPVLALYGRFVAAVANLDLQAALGQFLMLNSTTIAEFLRLVIEDVGRAVSAWRRPARLSWRPWRRRARPRSGP